MSRREGVSSKARPRQESPAEKPPRRVCRGGGRPATARAPGEWRRLRASRTSRFGTLARYRQETLADRGFEPCLYLPERRHHEAIVEPDLAATKGGAAHDAPGCEPGSHSEHVEVVKLFDLEPGALDLARKARPGISPVVIEGAVERSENRRHSRHQNEKVSTGHERTIRGAKELGIALHVLEDVDGDYAVRLERWRKLLEIAVANIDAGLGLEAAAESIGVGAVGLDQHQLTRCGALKYQIRHGPDSRPGFNCTAADPARE